MWEKKEIYVGFEIGIETKVWEVFVSIPIFELWHKSIRNRHITCDTESDNTDSGG